MINYVTICFNAIHKTFKDETEFKAEDIDESKKIRKFSRAVLRTLKLDVELVDNFELVKCNCGGVGRQVEEEEQIIQSDMKIKRLGWVEGDRFFLRKKEQTEISERQNNQISTELQPDRVRRVSTDEQDGSLDRSSTSLGSPAKRQKTYTDSGFGLNTSTPEGSKSRSTASSISEALGGDGWMTQEIGILGKVDSITTFSYHNLRSLRTAVLAAMKSPNTSKVTGGNFPQILVDALISASRERRLESPEIGRDLTRADFLRAVEMLEKKPIEKVDRSSSSSTDINAQSFIEAESSTSSEKGLSSPNDLDLSETGLSGNRLVTVKRICSLWKNNKWISQTLLPGLPPISLRDAALLQNLVRLAVLTEVKVGEEIPDGYPPVVFKVLTEAVTKASSQATRWSQIGVTSSALELLKKELGLKDNSSNSPRKISSSSKLPRSSMTIDEDREDEVNDSEKGCAVSDSEEEIDIPKSKVADVFVSDSESEPEVQRRIRHPVRSPVQLSKKRSSKAQDQLKSFKSTFEPFQSTSDYSRTEKNRLRRKFTELEELVDELGE